MEMETMIFSGRDFNRHSSEARRAANKGPGAVFRRWFEDQVLPAFAGRVLPVDTAVARRSAVLHVPDPAPFRDSLIAATALIHHMTLVTRNVADFQASGVELLNPWGAA